LKKFYFLLVSLLLFIVTSCATTKISSFTNPDIKISDYKKILVFANVQDVELRKNLENNLIEQFKLQNKDVVSSIEIISPLKEYSSEELSKIYSENGIDCFLIVSIINTTNESVYIPQQTHTNYSSQYVNGQLINIPYTTTSGGYSVSYPKASFEITLTDVKTGELAFKATANSSGDEFSDMKTISKSLAKEIVSEFIAQP
jgi:hypothetical protein